MNKTKEFLKNHVIITAMISCIAFLAIYSSVEKLMPSEKALELYLNGNPTLNLLISDAKRIAAIGLFTFPMMIYLGTFEISGIKTTKGINKGLILGLGVILLSWGIVAYSMMDTLKTSIEAGVFSWSDWSFKGIGLVLLVSLTCLLIGVLEETLCRGIMFLNMLEKWGASSKGLYKSIIISALPFGLLHLINLTSATHGADKLAIVFQVIYATAFGIFSAVLYLRCRNIWALILVHAIIDFAQLSFYIFIPSDIIYEMDKLTAMTQSNFISQSIQYVLFTLGLLASAYIMMRKVKVKRLNEASYNANLAG